MHCRSLELRRANGIILQRRLNLISHSINRHRGACAGGGAGGLHRYTACHLHILIIGGIIDHSIATFNGVSLQIRLHSAINIISRATARKIYGYTATTSPHIKAQGQSCSHLRTTIMSIAQCIHCHISIGLSLDLVILHSCAGSFLQIINSHCSRQSTLERSVVVIAQLR